MTTPVNITAPDKRITSYALPRHPFWRICIIAAIATLAVMLVNSTEAAVFDNIPITLVEAEAKELTRGRPVDFEVYGAYWRDTHDIFVVADGTYRMEHTVIHEKAHYLWFNFLTDFERDTYCQALVLEGCGVSRYSMINCAESFADNFAYYMGNDWRSEWWRIGEMEDGEQERLILEAINRFTE